jgi:hypothetical protein
MPALVDAELAACTLLLTGCVLPLLLTGCALPLLSFPLPLNVSLLL